MFRRKAAVDIEGEVCPYCEFVNPTGSETCVQCYYELNKAPRDQGEQITLEVSNSIFDELMSDDDDDSWEDVEALDVVLALDQEPVDVDQYSVTDFESEEPEKVGFMESSSPELHNTVAHEPVEVTAEDIGDAIPGAEKLDFSKEDPFDQIPEPVHQGKGAVYSPSSPTGMDEDLKGHVGGTELPSLPSEDLYENRIDLTAFKAPPPSPASVLPKIPEIQSNPPTPISQPVEQMPLPAVVNAVPEIEAVNEEVAKSETPSETEVTKETPPIISPPVDERIWPWAAGESWDARQIHREVVSALELTKSGHLNEAKSTIDSLGPHLTNENIDLIYHIGMVLKQIGRVDEAKLMLERAKISMPENEHVSSAIAHLAI
mgnify:CR=1 FL=1